MAYTLQPGMKFQIDPKSFPDYCAGAVMPWAQPSTLNYIGCRPSTMEFGRAPYMVGAPPAHLIGIDDSLRPQSTKRFGKVLVKPFEQGLFPLFNSSCIGPPRVMPYNSDSTRAQLQNGLFQQRYCSSK